MKTQEYMSDLFHCHTRAVMLNYRKHSSRIDISIRRRIFQVLKLKKVAASLAVSVILSSVAVIGASAVAPEPQVKSGGIITPQTVDKEWGDSFSGRSTADDVFNVNAGYGHVKLHVQNTGSTSFKVNLVHRSTGATYWSTTVAANSSADWLSWNSYPQGMKTGDYTITFSGGVNNATGSYWGKAADSTGDF
jgi:hypothetical protein